MTSNIGARHLQRKQGLGFQSEREDLVADKVKSWSERGETDRSIPNSSTVLTKSSSSRRFQMAI